jgi:hypothetical protein
LYRLLFIGKPCAVGKYFFRLSHLCVLKGLFKFSNRQRAADSSAELKKAVSFLSTNYFLPLRFFLCEFQFPRNLNSARYVNRWKSSRKNILSQWSTVHEQFNQGEK